jgi:glycerophosphoryl diester phosphodiesterase
VWQQVSSASKRSMAAFTHAPRTRPQFIAYSVGDLPAVIPMIARGLFGLPLLAWTVRSARDREKASRYADQMIFEGFRP